MTVSIFKRKRPIALTGCLVAALLAGCSSDDKTVQSPEKAVALVAGIDMANADASIRAQDDFYRHVNGQWLANTAIPADKSNYGSFTKLADDAEVQLRAIIEQAAATSAKEGTEQQKVGDFFKSYMNTEKLEALGVSPIAASLAEIDGLDSGRRVPEAVGEFAAMIEEIPVPHLDSVATIHLINELAPPDDLPDESLERTERHRVSRRVGKGALDDLLRSDQADVQRGSEKAVKENSLATGECVLVRSELGKPLAALSATRAPMPTGAMSSLTGCCAPAAPMRKNAACPKPMTPLSWPPCWPIRS